MLNIVRWNPHTEKLLGSLVMLASEQGTWEVEAGGSWVWGQPGLCSETVSKTKQNKKQSQKWNIAPKTKMFD
jgi:hypothetical protein